MKNNIIHCFTSINFHYLAKARVLAATLKRHHPDWVFHIAISDKVPPGFEFNLENEPFDKVIWVTDLKIPNLQGWIFKHDVVELCTAVKGPILNKLLDEGAEKVVYLDPDIAVFGDLSPIVEMLDTHDILLTPHQLAPDDARGAIFDNEICSLKHGIFNLGFVAIANRPEGKRFAKWWGDRLTEFCYDDLASGIFVDQKWCDLAPGFFDDLKVIRDPGYNVASWNLSQRTLAFDAQGNALVNGVPLRFYHFTKLGPLGDLMTQKYARENTEIYELWACYRRWVEKYKAENFPSGWWRYGHFDNGQKIPKAARVLYRSRADLMSEFPNPYRCSSGHSFFRWYQAHG
jgi:hypothetical protein